MTLIDNRRLSSLIEQIYDCVPDPERWNALIADDRTGFGTPDSVVPSQQTQELACLKLVLSEERRPVTGEDRRLADALLPHIRRAAVIAVQFVSIRRQRHAFQRVAERMKNSVLIVADDLAIIYANPLAKQMLADGDIVSSFRGRLVVVNPLSSLRLERGIKLSSNSEGECGEGFSLPLGDSSRPSIANLIPLAACGPDRHSGRLFAVAIVTAGPVAPLSLAIDAFSDLFALTEAEKRVAQLSAEGFGRAAIADLVGVKESTVKSQLEAIFSKTGASGQTALSILMRALSPPLR